MHIRYNSEMIMKKYEQRSEGFSSHMYCEDLETKEAFEGWRILEEM